MLGLNIQYIPNSRQQIILVDIKTILQKKQQDKNLQLGMEKQQHYECPKKTKKKKNIHIQ